MKKKILFIIGGVLLLFIITNPSVSAFKTFRGRDSYEGLKRPVNLFIYSIYKDHGSEYLGLFGNFWHISPPAPSADYLNQLKLDSIKRSNDSLYTYLTSDSSFHVYDTIGKIKPLRLYYNLLNNGYTVANLGNFEQFKTAIQDTMIAVKIYMNLAKDGYTVKNLGTLDEFKHTFCKNLN